MEHNAILADAAAGLSQQFLTQLQWMASALEPRLAALDTKFRNRLKGLQVDRPQMDSLLEITPGAAARLLLAGRGLEDFLEQVQYRGRRLAKLGLHPARVVKALSEFDTLLEAHFERHHQEQAANVAWARHQLHILSVLTLHNSFYLVREAESHAFYELFRAEVESLTLDEMLPRFLAVLMSYTGAAQGRMYLLEEDARTWRVAAAQPGGAAGTTLNLTPRVKQALAKARCIDLEGEENELALEAEWRRSFKTGWSIPLLSQRQIRGVLQFSFPKPYNWLPRELELLTAAAERCWLAAEKARLLDHLARREEQVQRLAEHMVEVEESERRRISRELHDEAGQSLLCMRLQIEMIEDGLPAGAESLRGKLAEVRGMTEHAIVEIRRLIAALSPAILEEIGLAAALRQLAGRFRRLHPADVRLQLPRRLYLPKNVEIIVYRLIQEVFNNIAKYSLASHVNLSVESADGVLRLHIEDDGVGFDVQEAFSRRDCYGLSGLRERVALLGGTLLVKSLPRATSVESASDEAMPKRSRTRKAGQIGVDRCGTATWIELPVPARKIEPGTARIGAT